MKRNLVLSIASLLLILLMTLHMADDVLYFKEGKWAILTSAAIFAVLLSGTLALAGRRAGSVIILLGSLLALAIAAVHTMGSGSVVSADLANGGGAFRFVWTLVALGAVGLFGAVLALQELVNAWRGRSG